MRWVYVLISVCGIVLAVLAHTAFWFGLGVAVAVVFALVGTIAFAHERIAGSARDEDLNASELQQLREAVRRSRAASATAPPPGDGPMPGSR